MAFFRSILKTLISHSTKTPRRNPSSSTTSRTFFSLCSAAQPFPHRSPYNVLVRDPIFSLHQNYFLRGNFLSPLFLSSPLWKLSQYATPVHLQCDIVLLRLPKVHDSLRVPYRLGFQPTPTKFLEESKEKDEGLAGSHIANATDAADSVVNVTHSYLNLPNFISLGRLVSGPLLGWMITQEMYLPAFVGLGISGASDWLDGYLARKMKINSVVGSYLDPLADKVLIGCVALGMVQEGLLHPGLVALVVLRDVALIGGAVFKRASSLEWQWKSWSDFFNLDGTNPEKVEPLLISKVNTVLQLLLVGAALLQPEFGNEETRLYITYLSWLVALTTLGSTAAYGAQQLRTGSKLRY